MVVQVSGSTLGELLRSRARQQPHQLAYRFLPDGEGSVLELDYAALHRRAASLASALCAVAQPGARVLVLCPPGPEYVVSLLGAVLAGMVAVPSVPPRFQRAKSRFTSLLSDAAPEVALGTRVLTEQGLRAARSQPELARLHWLASEDCTEGSDPNVSAQASDLTVLQYTSGSTSAPRGVMLAHAHLLENSQRIIEVARLTPDSQMVSWLPPYHDMGLIAGILTPLVAGCTATLLSPFSFVTRPVRWLEAITRYGGTHGGAPDFAYALCARRVSEAHKQALDLSSWQVAWSGAERVRKESLDAFEQAFSRVGFRAAAVRPSYGLAEATLIVSVAGFEGPRHLSVSEVALGQHQGRPAALDEDARMLVSCGKPVRGHQVKIVQPESRTELPEGDVGEIWVTGPSVALGYHGQPELSERTFRARLASGEGPFLRTGDLGFLHEGELYVTGRHKDLLIVRGRNHYPEDVEFTVQSVHPALRAGGGAAFSLEHAGEERVCVVQEVEGRALDFAALASEARESVYREHDLVLHELVLVAEGQVPKTSSGKVQRSELRQRYLRGELTARFRGQHEPTAQATPRLLSLVERECAELLDLARIPVHEDLFALGAQSVIAMQLAARLSRVLGRDVPLRTIFEHPSVHRLALALEGLSPAPALPPIVRSRAPGHAPLSLSQERMWFEHRLDPHSSAYNIAGALRVEGELSLELLQEVMSRLVQRHEVLRARYREGSTGPVQEIRPHTPLALTLTRLGQAEAERAALELARAPYDLEHDPLLRFAVFTTAEQRYLLVLVIHHIASDGLSMDVLLDELFSGYQALTRGEAWQPPAPTLSYPDYARWQREVLGDAAMERALSYWQRKLTGLPPLLALPSDRSRPQSRSARGELVTRELAAPLLAALDAFDQEHQVTRYMTLLATFYVLLGRLSGESDLCVGTPVAGRQAVETERLVGTFVNMLAMRNELCPDESFVALVGRVRSSVLEAFEHQHAPFERVVELLAPQRSSSHSPIFQVMFDYQVLRKLRTSVAGLELASQVLSRGAAQYDLSLCVVDLGESTRLHLEYRSDLFDAHTAESFAGRFLSLLEAALSVPRTAVARLPWFLPGEREALLALGAGRASPEPQHGSFLQAFHAQVQATPLALAVNDEREELSYEALDARANQLARELQRAGVQRGSTVAVFLERSVDLTVSLLAVLKASAAYVPLDPHHPAARIALVLEDAAPQAILSESRLLHALPAQDATVLVLDRERERIAQHVSTPVPQPALSPDELAYVIFTSGSTGRPKGVEISHGALHNFVVAMARELQLGAQDRVLATTTVSFDIAVLELLFPLTLGASVAIAPRELASDGPRLSERLTRGDITLFQATPASFRMLREAGFRGHGGLTLLCGGEALDRELAGALLEHSRALYNMYGPTETTVWSACGRVHEGEGPVPLGSAIDHTFLYVLDAQGEPVPRGVTGELYIGGRGVARGYRKRDELTRERFVADPFQAKDARMYRTGDAARFRGDGNLEFVGRVDQQVKLRGFRIELGEIEAQLASLTPVEACAVTLCELGKGDARLVAYVVPRLPHRFDPASLRTSLRERLPDYMVPAVFVALVALPLTPNGKVDRKALPRPAADAVPRETRPPRDAHEALVCACFAEVLGTEVGVGDDFFALGGHSLLAVRLFERLRARSGLELPLATLFSAPTPAGLAELLRADEVLEQSPAEQRESVRPALELAPHSGWARIKSEAARLRAQLMQALARALRG